MTRRVLIIYNPAAGQRRRRRLAMTVAELQRLGCQIRLLPTDARGHAARLAATCHRNHCDVLAIAGGDGTINEVVNGLEADAPPIAIIPLGTANVLAHEIGLRSRPKAVARTIASGRPQAVALGRANGHLFILMAGVGLDARVVATASLRLKRMIGKAAYVLTALKMIMRNDLAHFKLTIDGKRYAAAQIIVANGRRYAGRYLLAPDCRLESPGFQICLFHRTSRMAIFGYALALLADRLPRHRDISLIDASHAVIDGPSHEPVQLDGDHLTNLPVVFDIAPRSVELIYPAGQFAGTSR